ncbi:hypothetical protein ABK905_23590 [Acerihabitans sp. KWT182]|uniref:F-box domain-containing protein n=1 Tax=Acerihabitans sp. KWT182 TaxID=3157919 RepID=A0AAU7QAW9_9GAMM
MRRVKTVSSTLTRLGNTALKRKNSDAGDDSAKIKRPQTKKTARPTLWDMPELVLQSIISYIEPADILSIATMFNPEQKAYFSKEINYGRLVSDSLSWVVSIRDFDQALERIQTLPPRQRALPLIRLGGHVYQLEPGDRSVAMALFCAETRLHHAHSPSLAPQLRAIENASTFCHLLIGQVTPERCLREVAAGYGVTSPSRLRELERLIVNTLMGEEGWAGKNGRQMAAKYGICDESNITLLEQYIFTEMCRDDIGETATCEEIARRYGICSPKGREQLEAYRVRQFIGRKAQQGADCKELAKRYEITSTAARQCLEYYAVEGVLGERSAIRRQLPDAGLEVWGNHPSHNGFN